MSNTLTQRPSSGLKRKPIEYLSEEELRTLATFKYTENQKSILNKAIYDPLAKLLLKTVPQASPSALVFARVILNLAMSVVLIISDPKIVSKEVQQTSPLAWVFCLLVQLASPLLRSATRLQSLNSLGTVPVLLFFFVEASDIIQLMFQTLAVVAMFQLADEWVSWVVFTLPIAGFHLTKLRDLLLKTHTVPRGAAQYATPTLLAACAAVAAFRQSMFGGVFGAIALLAILSIPVIGAVDALRDIWRHVGDASGDPEAIAAMLHGQRTEETPRSAPPRALSMARFLLQTFGAQMIVMFSGVLWLLLDREAFSQRPYLVIFTFAFSEAALAIRVTVKRIACPRPLKKRMFPNQIWCMSVLAANSVVNLLPHVGLAYFMEGYLILLFVHFLMVLVLQIQYHLAVDAFRMTTAPKVQ
eukprot:gnl/Dysnectes_brevis/1290_a1446_1555.p1 GENE.gnl/Dysnectes_brevis/1290_a1446_1555~~gnl/Dysnectes_brevis/1290_a1446_1555.p1  ORF type:complete len:414 (-),score=155.18 gnl/Dysnectes_brevis/1290_a1446_1555:1669-2910(-)